MEAMRQPEFVPDEAGDERASRELVKLLRKLRWIGKEDEARELESTLRTKHFRGSVLAVPRETD